MMQRDEFIDGYMAFHEIPAECRTPTGFLIKDTVEKIAVRCDCDAPMCPGWQMLPASLAHEVSDEAIVPLR